MLVNVCWVDNKLSLLGRSFSKLTVKCMLAGKPVLACKSFRTLLRLFKVIRLGQCKLYFKHSKSLITYPTLEAHELRFGEVSGNPRFISVEISIMLVPLGLCELVNVLNNVVYITSSPGG